MGGLYGRVAGGGGCDRKFELQGGWVDGGLYRGEGVTDR